MEASACVFMPHSCGGHTGGQEAELGLQRVWAVSADATIKGNEV